MRWAFDIARASWRVLRANKSLVLFPVFSMVATLAVVAGVYGTVGLPVTFDRVYHVRLTEAGWPAVVVAYFLLSFVTIFCNAALVHAANEALEGRRATVGVGLRGAWARIVPILLWSLVSCTVSLVLRVIGRQFGIVGRIAEGIAAVAWALVTYFVVPVMIVDGKSVRDSVRRSKELLRKAWGSEVGGGLGIAALVWAVAALGMVVLLVIGLVVTFAGLGLPGLVGAIAAIGVWLLVVATVAAAISAVYRVVLHRFATGRPLPASFGDLDLSSALQPG